MIYFLRQFDIRLTFNKARRLIIHCQSSRQRAKCMFTCDFSASAAELKTKFNYQLASSARCHATPKINFYHLKNAYFAQVIRPKMPISSDFIKK